MGFFKQVPPGDYDQESLSIADETVFRALNLELYGVGGVVSGRNPEEGMV